MSCSRCFWRCPGDACAQQASADAAYLRVPVPEEGR